MVVLRVLLVLYLLGGFIYAFYVHLKGMEKWYMFPVNVIGGTAVTIYYLYIAKNKKRLRVKL